MMQDETRNKGHILLLVTVVVLLLFFTGSGVLALSSSAKKKVALQFEKIQSFYIAEAGIEKTISYLAFDSAFEGIDELLYGGGNANVIVYEEGISDGIKELRVVSTGRYSGASEAIEARLMLSVDPFLKEGNGINVRDSVYCANASINGCIMAGGDFLICDATVSGDIYSAGNLSIGDNVVISGNVYNNFGVPGFPIIDYNALKNASQSYGAGHLLGDNSIIDVSGMSLNGIYYIDGNLKIKGNYSGCAAFVADGNIIINGALSQNTDSSALVLISSGNIFIETDQSSAAVFICNGTFNALGGHSIKGCIAAGDLLMQGKEDALITFESDPDLIYRFPPGLPVSCVLKYFKELYPVF